MNKIKNRILLLLLLTLAGFSCSEPPLPMPQQEVPELTQKINGFIQDVMKDIYLWYKELPNIDIRYETDPGEYFEKLLYEEDKWSYITDDIEALENSFEGVETSFGYSLAFGQFTDTKNIFALVEFVYPDTPAADAGLKRGDMIFQMNNAGITLDNYKDLLFAGNLSITFGQYSEGAGIYNISSVNMIAEKLNLNPVLITDIIEHEGHKIGYLFYAQYISRFNTSLDSAFQHFVDEGVTSLVIDLRYNPGGVVTAAQYLCSSVAPLNVVNSKKILVTYQWNDKYQRLWITTGNRAQIEETFVDSAAVQMGLNKVYFLTGGGTASASELTITGLSPYMDVVTVGETTYGKYTGSWTLKPEDYYDDPSYYSDFDNWGIQPIILRFANSLGVTDFKDGFFPDIPVDDDLFSGIPLGDKQDPLLKAAIDDIAGIPVVAMKKARVKAPYTLFDRGFSRFDANKREMLLDHIPFPGLDKGKKLP